MLFVILLPILALIGGLGGFFLRKWELATAFESSGLAIPGTTASICLMALSILLAVALGLLCTRYKYSRSCYVDAFPAPGNWACLVAAALAAACFLGSGVVLLKDELSSAAPRLLFLLLGALCILAFFCVLLTALRNFRGDGKNYSLSVLAPAYACCLWLASAYLDQAVEPVTLSYVYELLAIVCMVLAFYFTAGFSFGRPRIWRCAFFGLLGIYFSIVTQADDLPFAFRLLFLSAVLLQLTNLLVLLRRAFCAPPKRLLNESNHTQEVTPDE